jgi:hypothetical protein
VQFQQLTSKLHLDPVAIYGADEVDVVLPKPEAPHYAPGFLLCKNRRRSLRFKDFQLRSPRCQVTTMRRLDRNISAAPDLVPSKSNLSKPSLIPLFLSLKSLDMYGNPGSWAASANARTKRLNSEPKVVLRVLLSLHVADPVGENKPGDLSGEQY